MASKAGADFLGLNFVPNRRRRLSAEAALEVVETLKAEVSHPPKVVGLFADQPLEEVNNLIKRCPLDMVQLCGGESLDYCRGVKAPVIKVVHVPEGSHTRGALDDLYLRVESFANQGHLVTLDRLVKGLQGGTGATFDWQVAAELSKKEQRFFLAGGLTPDNLAQAISVANPWGVDVSSGVETDGVKDPDKVRQFVAQARRTTPVSGGLI